MAGLNDRAARLRTEREGCKIDVQIEADALANDLTALLRRVRQLRLDIRDLVQA